MDKIITALIGIGLFLLFVGGLAESIGSLPFTIIVIIVCCATIYGLYEDVRSSRPDNQD
ncbi:MAG: hypothetical protein WD075_09180 [Rhodospirillales bacterium]